MARRNLKLWKVCNVQVVVDEIRAKARGIRALEAHAYFLMSLKARLCLKMEGLRKAKKEGKV
jgi:hypothetical protein